MIIYVSEGSIEVIWGHLRSFRVIQVLRCQNLLYYRHATLTVLFLYGLIKHIGHSVLSTFSNLIFLLIISLGILGFFLSNFPCPTFIQDQHLFFSSSFPGPTFILYPTLNQIYLVTFITLLGSGAEWPKDQAQLISQRAHTFSKIIFILGSKKFLACLESVKCYAWSFN